MPDCPSVTCFHGYRAYAGILCGLDTQQREFTALRLAHLVQPGQRVVTGLDLRRDQAISTVAGAGIHLEVHALGRRSTPTQTVSVSCRPTVPAEHRRSR